MQLAGGSDGALVDCDHGLRGNFVPFQQWAEFPDPGPADGVVLKARNALRRVAEWQVPRVVKQSGRPRGVVAWREVRDEGEDPERVLQTGVGLGARD